jgi:hypothetical protein
MPKHDMGYLAAFIREHGGSEAACEFFAKMTEREWDGWQFRYHVILDGNGKALTPPLTWWEKEFHQSLQLGQYQPPDSKPVQ